MSKRYIDYLPSVIRKQLILVPEHIKWAEMLNGGRRLVETMNYPNTGEPPWDMMVSAAIANQNKAIYLYLRKVLPKEYWFPDGNGRAFTNMIKYGLYEWIREFCHEVWTNTYEQGEYDFLCTALVAHDPIIIEFLLQWGLKVSSGTISTAVWRTSFLSKEYFATSADGYARLSVSRGDFVELLLPFKDKYNINSDLLIE